MIKITHGDILRADAEAIINTVNCVGVMGRGIALQFKKAWPNNFNAYAVACKKQEVMPGKMFIFETGQLANPLYIINFPTKRHWKGASRIEDIEAGLVALVNDIKRLNIKSIAIPPLGAGLGGLDWKIVREKIEAAMVPLNDVEILLYEPAGAPQNDTIAKQKAIPNMTAGRAVLVELVQRYLKGLLDPTVSLLEVHKLLYFMQEAGEPLRLKYEKAHYGPYAQNLRHVLNAIEGHFISGYADGGDAPEKELRLVPGAVEDAQAFLIQHPATRARFEKVSQLVEGFESPQGLELLATVHWLSKHEQAKNTEELVQKVHSWNARKKMFTPRQIAIAEQVLKKQDWMAA
ncbi:macro domain-containing protein [Agitococcus lubricus]|uniref:O-acetyl-ADP-ribose deacetylase (Regulator of RNase III) n=1 Tax=Agitococcus lubricus TaxID=1077255 RepID=A0A2T5IU63_9GAMM|nr:macro domain-containing protein [Agitococcus lubricus]PTQ87358.1 O-acetyl-ADP-ribose deacetylase (regulator of RNase III) [Agitococcus lubricus]